jgi:hypothetical protein
MPIGKYRDLTKEEFIELNKLISNSTKIYESEISKRKPRNK